MCGVLYERMSAVKRGLILCALIGLLLVPAALGATSLSADCTTCALGSTVTLSGSGYKDNVDYIWTAATVPDVSWSKGASPVRSSGGVLTFSFAPPIPGTYEVRVWSTGGRSQPKPVSIAYFTVA